MEEKNHTRQQVHDKFMKSIILRLDYAGVTEGDNLTKLFDKKFPKAFKKRNEVYNRELNISFREADLKEISESVSLPMNVIRQEKLVRYQELHGAICHVSLDISQYYLCMTITCANNYDGLDKYLEVFKGAITVFKSDIDYFNPKRLGIRKVRVQPFEQLSEMSNVFESYAFNVNPLVTQNNCSMLQTRIFDCIEDSNTRLMYNIIRKISLGENGTTGTKQFLSILDIDAYCKDESILNDRLNVFIQTANQQEFEIYKLFMNKSYLDSISQL